MKACKTCGETLTYQKSYCSRACLYEGRREDTTLTCQICNKEFKRKKWEIRQGHYKYCSYPCSTEGKRGIPRYDSRKPEEKECEVCGIVFLAGGRGNPPRKQVRCSLECQSKGRVRPGREAYKLTIEQSAYLAGIIDGEGSIMLIARMRDQQGCALRLNISNTHKGLLDWVTIVTGIGRTYLQTEGDRKNSTSYNWRCHGDGAYSLLEQIEPYLIIKKPQADLGMDAHERLRIPSLKADRTWQEEYRLRMKALNKRGSKQVAEAAKEKQNE